MFARSALMAGASTTPVAFQPIARVRSDGFDRFALVTIRRFAGPQDEARRSALAGNNRAGDHSCTCPSSFQHLAEVGVISERPRFRGIPSAKPRRVDNPCKSLLWLSDANVESGPPWERNP